VYRICARGAFVALDSNPDAHFTHGDSSIPAVAGRLFRFNGSIKHATYHKNCRYTKTVARAIFYVATA